MKKEDYISITEYLQWAEKNCRNSLRKNYHQLKKNDIGPNYPLTKIQQKKACEKLGIQFRSQFKVDK